MRQILNLIVQIKKDGFYSDVTKCGSYYECRDGVTSSGDCVGNYEWNSELTKCDHPKNSDCTKFKKQILPNSTAVPPSNLTDNSKETTTTENIIDEVISTTTANVVDVISTTTENVVEEISKTTENNDENISTTTENAVEEISRPTEKSIEETTDGEGQSTTGKN